MNVLIVDNYDSFVYNIVQVFRESETPVELTLVKHTAIPFDSLGRFDGIVLSPGPGIPEEAAGMMELLERAGTILPILGICLGHQAIIEHFGGRLANMQHPLHGHPSTLTVTDRTDPIFNGIPDGTRIGRYHSWTADPGSLPPCLASTSVDEQGNIMSVRHLSLPLHGVQFHPESHITEMGRKMIDNWIKTL